MIGWKKKKNAPVGLAKINMLQYDWLKKIS